jgi:hypothetical protein
VTALKVQAHTTPIAVLYICMHLVVFPEAIASSTLTSCAAWLASHAKGPPFMGTFGKYPNQLLPPMLPLTPP